MIWTDLTLTKTVTIIIDNDMDGFNSDEDCDDENAEINPDAEEIPGNDVDENCDGLIVDTSIEDISLLNVVLAPNPASEMISISAEENIKYEIYDLTGRSHIKVNVYNKTHVVDISQFQSGIYMIRITDSKDKSQLKKVIVE